MGVIFLFFSFILRNQCRSFPVLLFVDMVFGRDEEGVREMSLG